MKIGVSGRLGDRDPTSGEGVPITSPLVYLVSYPEIIHTALRMSILKTELWFSDRATGPLLS